ncbi:MULTISPECIES: copper resistance CopC family protein [Nonomuraea]|uniref:Copper resistance protein CopC n=1 Tax=Nonomuraea ferruginea TaxID=46174 RepID=A0ABT4SW39_9ACTN|nr:MULTISPECIES: copper resistance CopC family protein [Nonomuraea]MDA0641484.1 copper resistance protein CopC [Nonomuraea ferruginea]TXK42102.1 copper resistance protein CopC [Nonomuraea sp. C10]
MKSSPLAALTAILATLLVLVTAGPALAHDALKSSDPAKDATVESVDEITLEFTGKIRMPFVSVRGPGDTQHQAGDPELDGVKVKQALKGELPDGDYTIAYRVVSSDGHPIEGEIPFTVKGASPSPAETPEGSTAPTAEATTAEPAPTATEPAEAQPAEEVSAESDAATFPVWLLIVVGALVGIGIGFLMSARKKKQP